jgi:hypothetical protein
MSATSTVPVVLEPDAQAFAEAVATPPFVTELGPEKGREVLESVQLEAHAARPDVRIEDFTILGQDGQVKVRILKPAALRDPLPVMRSNERLATIAHRVLRSALEQRHTRQAKQDAKRRDDASASAF